MKKIKINNKIKICYIVIKINIKKFFEILVIIKNKIFEIFFIIIKINIII